MSTKREYISDEEVEKELNDLKASPYVKLARREDYLKNKYRKQLYTLRCLEKRGRELVAQGITIDTINKQIEQIEQEEIK